MSHVLIVDDEESICWGLERLLTEAGHEVQRGLVGRRRHCRRSNAERPNWWCSTCACPAWMG